MCTRPWSKALRAYILHKYPSRYMYIVEVPDDVEAQLD